MVTAILGVTPVGPGAELARAYRSAPAESEEMAGQRTFVARERAHCVRRLRRVAVQTRPLAGDGAHSPNHLVGRACYASGQGTVHLPVDAPTTPSQ
ncbi:Uncharacterised protein [Mycobacteroides abscessus subsp. abscessus]|nr:Uncharacterised protein [Mycobacteroides abscessus subsp. abscessus]